MSWLDMRSDRFTHNLSGSTQLQQTEQEQNKNRKHTHSQPLGKQFEPSLHIRLYYSLMVLRGFFRTWPNSSKSPLVLRAILSRIQFQRDVQWTCGTSEFCSGFKSSKHTTKCTGIHTCLQLPWGFTDYTAWKVPQVEFSCDIANQVFWKGVYTPSHFRFECWGLHVTFSQN